MLLMKAGLRALGEGNVFVLDSKPIPVCKPLRSFAANDRHGRVRLLRDEGAYFGKNKAGWYFGYKLHVLAHPCGAVIGTFLTPANWDDRDVLAALAEGLEGNSILLADLGYRDARELEPLLLRSEYGIVLVTPAHAPTDQRALISSVWERIETVFSCLWQRFVDRVFSRSFEGLWIAIQDCYQGQEASLQPVPSHNPATTQLITGVKSVESPDTGRPVSWRLAVGRRAARWWRP